MSESYRLADLSRAEMEGEGVSVRLLDLSRLASEFGREIHPCKACFSTAAALCHWPCSCYPNYSLGQTNDWMNDIYPMGVRAHGIMIVTPVNWYQVSSPLKLMMDRMVCAAGGNHVVGGVGALVPGQHQRTISSLAYPLREPAGERRVIVGHRDDVEAGPGRFVAQNPGRERAVAGKRVYVEVAGQHQVPAGA
jgi:multimeric flavodoxin WrbA